MPDYRRNRVPGGTYFFTVNLRERQSNLLVTHIAALREAVRKTRTARPFHIDAWVVLPDHMHCVWTLPDGDTDFPGRWRAIKTVFSKSVALPEQPSGTIAGRDTRSVWQPRYWEHTMRDERDYAAHVDYTHFNPVKHGYVRHPADWPYSSFHRCVAAGMYPAAWRGGDDEPREAGEREEDGG